MPQTQIVPGAVIPDEYLTRLAIADAERARAKDRDVHRCIEDEEFSITHAVLAGDVKYARMHAITLALHRDRRHTLPELRASMTARDEYKEARAAA